jgi:predicted DNA-binding ribbon-helix-helix protein
MKSLVIKRSIVIAGHKTSVSLEDMFWTGLKDIAERQHVTLSTMVGDIDTLRQQGNLSSAIRLFVLDQFRKQATDQMPKRRPDYVGESARPATDDAVLSQG